MPEILQYLRENGVRFTLIEHPAVFTCAESKTLLPLGLPGAHTKNLFLTDDRGSRLFLVVITCEKRADLKALRQALDVNKLSFADTTHLKEYLGVEPGAVTMLGLIHDQSHRVEVIIDQDVWKASHVQCHPLRNTATLILEHEGLLTFLKATGHAWKAIDVPKCNET